MGYDVVSCIVFGYLSVIRHEIKKLTNYLEGDTFMI